MSRDDRPPAIEKGPCGCAPFSGLGGEGKRRRVAGDQKKKKKEKKKEKNERKKWGGWKELHKACFQPWTRSRLMKGKEQRGIRQWTGDIRAGWIARNRKLPLYCHFAINCLFIQMMMITMMMNERVNSVVHQVRDRWKYPWNILLLDFTFASFWRDRVFATFSLLYCVEKKEITCFLFHIFLKFMKEELNWIYMFVYHLYRSHCHFLSLPFLYFLSFHSISRQF